MPMVVKGIVVAGWGLVMAFWALQFVPGIEDPFPLSPERRASTIYSDWRPVGQDAKSGETIYERQGVTPLLFHTAFFSERKIGIYDRPDMWSNDVSVSLPRVGIGVVISAGLLAVMTRGLKPLTQKYR